MKFTKKTIIFSIFWIAAGLFCSCSEDLEQPMPPIIQPVENLEVELVGDTAHVTWENPPHDGVLNAIIKHNNGTHTQENATSFKYGIIDVNTNYRFTVKLTDSEGNISPGKTVHLLREGPNPVKNLKGAQEERSVILKWELPEADISNIRLVIDGSEEILLPANATSYTLTDVELREYTFQITVIDSENNTSPAKYLKFTAGATKIAYLGVAPDVSSISDDDEIASATWFFENYPDGEYLSFEEIKAGKDLSQYRVLWWHYDNQEENPALPAIAADEVVKTAITDFHKNGGALLLNTHAIQYLHEMGRIPDFGKIVGAGAGFHNDGTWGVQALIGQTHDKSSHPLYEGLEMRDGKVIPLLGPGWREDHNYVFAWLPEFYGFANNDEGAYKAISEENNINILGQWDGFPDYWMMGFFETKPTEEFKGTAIALGIGAFEWNKNDGENQYRENIEKITENALNYLRIQ